MNIDPDVVDMIAKIVGVNAVAALLLAVLSYAGSALLLRGLEAVDRRLDPSYRKWSGHPTLPKSPIQPPGPTRGNGT